ncbi:hypothetical protein CEXT_183451 [Caerostris extrusa]|uniref:Uncharacterized protein n=1 Tax=Caerostris extrusa TaxID=172846 RepID=A0AAV4MR23_CAEEX|nr:hypothetical protein CEXT_183451 [Caerostris extrusa]
MATKFRITKRNQDFREELMSIPLRPRLKEKAETRKSTWKATQRIAQTNRSRSDVTKEGKAVFYSGCIPTESLVRCLWLPIGERLSLDPKNSIDCSPQNIRILRNPRE